MTRIRIEGATTPGRYLVTAYGGEANVWPQGATGQPLLLRRSDPVPLDAGVFEGVIGPFGSARFAAPVEYDAFRLTLSQPAPARLDGRRGAASRTAAIVKASRDPFALIELPGGDEAAKIEVSGFEGQTFSLRAARRNFHYSFEGAGPYLIGVDLAGEGGDEIEATALFARVEKDGKSGFSPPICRAFRAGGRGAAGSTCAGRPRCCSKRRRRAPSRSTSRASKRAPR